MGNNILVAQNVCTTHKILSGFTDAFKAVKSFTETRFGAEKMLAEIVTISGDFRR